MSFAILFSAVAVYVIFIYASTKTNISQYTMNYYLEHFYTDTWAENAVTAIYLNYRMFDSVFETLMLLISAAAVISFSRRSDHEKGV
ncbi:MAG: hypothetical protein ACK5ML_12955 [Lachnospiraceae bacterium]